MIYTSYFAMLKKLPKNIIPVSIALISPYWFNGIKYKKLAPTFDILNEWRKNHNIYHYEDCYQSEILDNLNVLDVMLDFEHMLSEGKSKDICLLCYEKPTVFCHRHLVSKWLMDNGILCHELIL